MLELNIGRLVVPEFPRYESKGQLTTQTNSAQAPTDTSAKMLEQTSKVGQSLQDVSIKWMNAVDTIQETTANANFKIGMEDIKNRAQNDPNYNNSDQYFKEIEKLKSDNLKGFSSKSTANKMAINFGYEAKVGQIQIQNLYKKKMIDVGQVSADKLINSEIDYANENPDNAFSNIKIILDKQVQAGIYSATEAQKKYKESVKTIGALIVSNDPSTQEDQSVVLAELRKGDQGKYAEIPPDDRLDLIKASQQRIFNNNQTYKRDTQDASNLRSNALIDKLASGEATIKDIEAEMAVPEESGGMKRSQLLTYQRALISGVKGNLDRMLQEKTPDHDPTKRAKDVKSYIDLIDNFIDSKTDQWKAKEMLASAFEDGIINSKEQQFLNGLKQNLKDIEFNRNTSPIAIAIKGLKNFFRVQSNSSDEVIARNIKTLIGDVSSGTQPEVALRKILSKEVSSRIPDLANYPKTGKLKRDGNGNIIRVFPDGSYIDEPSQGTKATK